MKPTSRLDQMLSRYGYCSRAEARAWLRAGRVTVGGTPADDPSQKAGPLDVLVDGVPLECPLGLLAVLHKPAGFVCSHDPRDGPTIYELLPSRWLARNPPVTTIGRLDKDTTGVLLVTDIGPLVQRWTSPRHHVTKLYEATFDRELDPELIERFASGTLQLEGESRPCLPARLEIVESRKARLELTEGMYHQVKRMFYVCGYRVERLHRSRFHDVELEGLPEGKWRLIGMPDSRYSSTL